MMLFVIAVPCQVPSDICLPLVVLVSHNYRLTFVLLFKNCAVNEVELGFFPLCTNTSCADDKYTHLLLYNLNRGRREDGRLGSAKKSKTPFFKRYFKILSRGYSNGSRTSPIFFFFKYLNKYGC